MIICSVLIDQNTILFRSKIQFCSYKFMVDFGIFKVFLHIKNAQDFLIIFNLKLPIFIPQKFEKCSGIVLGISIGVKLRPEEVKLPFHLTRAQPLILNHVTK